MRTKETVQKQSTATKFTASGAFKSMTQIMLVCIFKKNKNKKFPPQATQASSSFFLD